MLKYPQPAGQTAKTVLRYEPQVLIDHFQAVFDSYDFKRKTLELGLKPWPGKKQRLARREMQVISIALWHLAMQRSLPEEADFCLAAYREHSWPFSHEKMEACLLQTRLNIHLDLLKEKRDADFSPTARYLAELLSRNEYEAGRMRIKLALLMRKLYALIFDRLVPQ